MSSDGTGRWNGLLHWWISSGVGRRRLVRVRVVAVFWLNALLSDSSLQTWGYDGTWGKIGWRSRERSGRWNTIGNRADQSCENKFRMSGLHLFVIQNESVINTGVMLNITVSVSIIIIPTLVEEGGGDIVSSENLYVFCAHWTWVHNRLMRSWFLSLVLSMMPNFLNSFKELTKVFLMWR